MSNTPSEYDKVTNIADYRKQSATVRASWNNTAVADLLRLKESLPEDINLLPNAYPHAKDFIEKLPIQIEGPSLDIEDTGKVLVEWAKREASGNITIFSVAFDGKGILYSLFEDGRRTDYFGHISFSDRSIDMILPTIKQHFGIMSDGRRFNAQ
jgi:hypothetical protein